MLIQSKRKNTWYYFWRFLSLAILNLWLVVILENWPRIIHNSSDIFLDKKYLYSLDNGFTGSHSDLLIQCLINEAGVSLILVIIFVTVIIGFGGFIKDTYLIIKKTGNLINKNWHS